LAANYLLEHSADFEDWVPSLLTWTKHKILFCFSTPFIWTVTMLRESNDYILHLHIYLEE
jgi:hypothetical protein